MKLHRSDMLSQNFAYNIYKFMIQSKDVVNLYNHNNNTNIDINKIQITKIVSNHNGKSYKMFYIVYDLKYYYIDFMKYIMKPIIRKLRSCNRIKHFPRITVIYDNKYEQEIIKKS